MPENKKQHYVPKFYLKEFATNADATFVGVLVKKTGYITRNAAISKQAYEDYFYGDDGVVEKGFSELEGNVAKLFNKIRVLERLPEQKTEEYLNLWIFTLLQAARTKNSAKETSEMVNVVLQKMMKYDDSIKEFANQYELVLKNATVFNLQVAIEGIHIGADLESKLIINQSNVPFISSDHPVIKYNQFMEIRKHPFYCAGLASKGLQIFYPLTPKLMLVLYDSKVYRFKNRKRNYIETKVEADINQLNKLQFLNSDIVIFFNHQINDYYLTSNLNLNQRLILNEKVTLTESASIENADGTFTIPMHGSRNEITTGMQLSFIKLTDYAKSYKWTGYAVELRDEKMRNRENRNINLKKYN